MREPTADLGHFGAEPSSHGRRDDGRRFEKGRRKVAYDEWSMGDDEASWEGDPSGPSAFGDPQDFAHAEPSGSGMVRRATPAAMPRQGGGAPGPGSDPGYTGRPAGRGGDLNATQFAAEPYRPPVESGPAPGQGSMRMLPGHVKLVVEQGKILGERFLLNDVDLLIGRLDAGTGNCPDIDLSAQDPAFVHRRHVRLRFEVPESALYLEDLGGRNGSFVNNRPVTPRTDVRLRVGDKIRIGRVVMRLLEAPEMHDE